MDILKTVEDESVHDSRNFEIDYSALGKFSDIRT